MSAETWVDGLDLLRAAGAIVVPVEDFAFEAAWVSDLRLLVVATDLTTEQRQQVVLEYLPTVLEEPQEADR